MTIKEAQEQVDKWIKSVMEIFRRIDEYTD